MLGEITEPPVSIMITVIDFHYYGFTVIAIHVYFTHTVVTVGMVR